MREAYADAHVIAHKRHAGFQLDGRNSTLWEATRIAIEVFRDGSRV